MKVIKRDLGGNFKSIKLIALSDFHIGDALCNLKLIRQVLQEVKESPNTFIILNGDLMNNATKTSVSDKVIADLYIMGHTHTPIITRNTIYLPDYQHRTLVKKDKYFLMTNSFLEYGGYGEQYGFTPTTTDHQEAILNGTKKEIKLIM